MCWERPHRDDVVFTGQLGEAFYRGQGAGESAGQSATLVGSVNFVKDGRVFTVANVDGAAWAVLRSSRLGAHAIAATYKPSGLFAASESAAARDAAAHTCADS